MSRLTLPNFIWIPKDKTTKWTVNLNGRDISDDILSASFTRSIIGEEMGFEIELENSGEAYTGEFQSGQVVQFLMDFSSGTTNQFEGKIEFIKKKIGAGYTLNIKGSHYTADLLDVTVSEEFTSTNVSTILRNIISSYMTEFTSTNVETIDVLVDIKWNNKSFLDCVLDLMKLADADCYVDNSKDFHFFRKNSKENFDEALVEGDTLIELYGLGEDSVDVRNKIIVYGESGGLPVIHTSQDSSSQTTYGTKEKIIEDTSVIDEDQAKDFGDAETSQVKNPPSKGSASSHFMEFLNPGDSLWVASTPHDITAKFRLVKYVFYVPDETMEVTFSQEESIPKLFKDRIQKDTQQESISNPNKMLYSYNFAFDNLNKINTAASSNIEATDGNLKTISGNDGTMISITKNTEITVNNGELRVVGENLGTTQFWVSADGTDTGFQRITSLNTLFAITSTGKQLRIKVVFTSSDTRIDSLAFYYK